MKNTHSAALAGSIREENSKLRSAVGISGRSTRMARSWAEEWTLEVRIRLSCLGKPSRIRLNLQTQSVHRALALACLQT